MKGQGISGLCGFQIFIGPLPGPIDFPTVQRKVARSRFTFGAMIADIGFRRLVFRCNGAFVVIDRGFLQAEKITDVVFCDIIMAFAEMRIDNVSLLIDQIVGRPVFVVEVIPCAEIVIERHGIVDFEFLRGRLDIFFFGFKGKFRRVDAQHDKTLILVLFIPACDIRQRTDAIDARIRPEIDEYDFAFQLLHGQRVGIDPALNSRNLWSGIRCRQPILQTRHDRSVRHHALRGTGFFHAHIFGRSRHRPFGDAETGQGQNSENNNDSTHDAANDNRVFGQRTKMFGHVLAEQGDHQHGDARADTKGRDGRDRLKTRLRLNNL